MVDGVSVNGIQSLWKDLPEEEENDENNDQFQEEAGHSFDEQNEEIQRFKSHDMQSDIFLIIMS